MKKTLLLSLVLASVAITGCATGPSLVAPDSSSAWITPQQAILLAANSAPRGAPGIFAMTVQATGTQDGQVFLNSELDYRDQRNLTIALTPAAARQLRERLGEDPLTSLKNRSILVTGAARRAQIYFFSNGKRSDKYYYQTHVDVSSADQLVLR